MATFSIILKHSCKHTPGGMYSIQQYILKIVSDLRQVGGFYPGTPVSSTNKTGHHDIAEILLKVALNTITLTLFSHIFRASMTHLFRFKWETMIIKFSCI